MTKLEEIRELASTTMWDEATWTKAWDLIVDHWPQGQVRRRVAGGASAGNWTCPHHGFERIATDEELNL